MKRCYFVVLVALFSALGSPAAAQYIYIDTNEDGMCSSDDVLHSGVTAVGVYLITDENADGSSTTCPSGEDLTMGSYSFILRRGTEGSASQLTFGQWTDELGYTMGLTDQGARMEGGTDLWIGLGGAPLPPGKHKLGSLAVTVTGRPFVYIVTASAMSAHAETHFASACLSSDADNTMELGVDFFDVCATGFVSEVSQTTWGKIKAAYR